MSIIDGRVGPLFLKSAIVGLLTLAMLLPLARVESLIREREGLRESAHQRIAELWGAEQLVGGPILSVPTEDFTSTAATLVAPAREGWAAGEPLHRFIDELRLTASLEVSERRKGIYALPVYVTRLQLRGSFAPESLAALKAWTKGTRTIPARASLAIPISGLQSIRAVQRFDIGGRALRPEGGRVMQLGALVVPLDLETADLSRPLEVAIDLALAGSSALRFMPLGATTNVRLDAPWPHPNFDGAFVPISHTITAQGFRAEWNVLQLNRGLAQQWRGESDELASALRATAFGVQLFQPADVYTRSWRAVRYGLLFVAITFMCFFAWEHLSRGVRLHPMQYLLVGLSLATFYLLLLALSEHIGFALAYGVAAAALVLLISVYIAGATGRRVAAGVIGFALAIAYGVLYLILSSEDYALLLGALFVFGVLAVLMLATRRLDWSAVGARTSAQPAAAEG